MASPVLQAVRTKRVEVETTDDTPITISTTHTGTAAFVDGSEVMIEWDIRGEVVPAGNSLQWHGRARHYKADSGGASTYLPDDSELLDNDLIAEDGAEVGFDEYGIQLTGVAATTVKWTGWVKWTFWTWANTYPGPS